MRWKVLACLTVVCGLWAGAAHAQEKLTDPAQLMPAKVLGYLELRQPGPLVKEIASLFEGSALGNVPDSWHKYIAKMAKGQPVGPMRGFNEVGVVGVIFSPEVVKEVSRIHGAAVAVTGVGRDGMPEFLAVVLPGDCVLPGLGMRALLSAAPVTPVEEVEGVTIYQLAMFGFAEARPPVRAVPVQPGVPQPIPGVVPKAPPFEDRPTFPKPPPAVRGEPPDHVHLSEVVQLQPGGGVPKPGGPRGPSVCFAMMPDVLLAGSHKEVKDAIGRAKAGKGKAKGGALSVSEDFHLAREQVGNKPGLFAYGDMAAILDCVERNAPFGKDERVIFNAIVDAINPKAFKTVAIGVTLSDGTLSAQAMIGLDPEQKSPVLDILPTQPIKADILHFVPKDAMFAVVGSQADGEQRLKKVVELADKIMRALGEQDRASAHLEQLENMLGISIGKDVIGKLRQSAVAMGDIMPLIAKGPGGIKEPPVVVILQATDEEAATSLVNNVLPKVLSKILGNDIKPVTKKVDGQDLSILDIPGPGPIAYGRFRDTIVFGPNQATVAASLNAGSKQQGLLTDKKVAAAVQKADNPFVFGVVKPVAFAAGMFAVYTTERQDAIKRFNEVAPPPLPPGRFNEVPPPLPPGVKPPPVPKPLPPAQADPAIRAAVQAVQKEPAQAEPKQKAPDGIGELTEVLKLAQDMDPLVIYANRKPDRITIAIQQSGLKPAVAKFTDMGLMFFLMARKSDAGFGPGGRPEVDFAVPPPLPKLPPKPPELKPVPIEKPDQ